MSIGKDTSYSLEESFVDLTIYQYDGNQKISTTWFRANFIGFVSDSAALALSIFSTAKFVLSFAQ